MKKIAYLLLFLLLLPGVASASNQVEVLALEGRAQYRLEDAWEKLEVGSKISQGAQVRTFEDSIVLIAFPQGHQILLGSNVDLILSNLAPEEIKLCLSLGKVWSRVRKQLKGLLKFEIETPSAVAGVRGTQFSVEVLATGITHVSVWEGRVWVGDRLQEIDLSQQQTTTADPHRGLSEPRPMEEQEKKEWEKIAGSFIHGKVLEKIPPGLEKKKEKWEELKEKRLFPQGRPWSEGGIPHGLAKDKFLEGQSWLEEKIPFGPPEWAQREKEFIINFPGKKNDTE